jgi:hypothetical protein
LVFARFQAQAQVVRGWGRGFGWHVGPRSFLGPGRVLFAIEIVGQERVRQWRSGFGGFER